MSAAQKHAWFNLLVVGAALIAVGVLCTFFGSKGHAGLAIGGLLGFGPFFFRRKGVDVVVDERDMLIQRRSALLGYSVFWVVFVFTASVLSMWIYGWDGSVPVHVVQISVFYAMMLFVAVMSLATLIQYGWRSTDGKE